MTDNTLSTTHISHRQVLIQSQPSIMPDNPYQLYMGPFVPFSSYIYYEFWLNLNGVPVLIIGYFSLGIGQ